jgi:hypothetical protein
MNFAHKLALVATGSIAALGVSNAPANAIDLTPGTAYTQDFNTLTATGATGSTLPAGWSFSETANANSGTYGVDAGSSNGGNTYSYGAASSTDRAFGSLASGSVQSTFGAFFTITGADATTLDISFTNEQWRRGTTPSSGASTPEKIAFSYSTNATSITAGTWTSVSDLDLLPIDLPNSGTVGSPTDGNTTRKFLNATIAGSFTAGSNVWIRWVDSDSTGADYGLAVDDFSITAQATAVPSPALLPGIVGMAMGIIRKRKSESI